MSIPKADKDIRQKALDLLSRREHSRRELFLKLCRYDFSSEEIDRVLNEIQNENLLSEDRFIESFIRARRSKGHGPLKICAELQNRGIDPSRIFVSEEWLETDWQERADAVRIKRFGEPVPVSRIAQAKQGRYLQQRGFTIAQIRKIFQSIK